MDAILNRKGPKNV